MKQFAKIFDFELKSYLKNKVFIGITVVFILLTVGLMFFPRVMKLFSGDDSSTTTERAIILVKAESEEQADEVRDSFAAAFGDYDVRSTEEGVEAIKKMVAEGKINCAFVITGATSYDYYVGNLSMYDEKTFIADEIMLQLYRMHAMIDNGLSSQQAAEIMSVRIDSQTVNLGKNQANSFFYTYIMIFALYMVILLYGQMVATNVASEKSSRAMELLITSAKPVSMMFGKVIASCLAGFIQLTAIFGTTFVCYSLNKSYWSDISIMNSIFAIPPTLLGYMLLFFVLGFFIYAFLYGAIGSTASKIEDVNTSVMPVTMFFVVAFMVVMFSLGSGNVDTVIMKICSFVPFTSPMAMFTRIAMSTVPWYEIVISVAVLIASVIGVGVLAAKIYRVGVVLYGTSPKLGTILKLVFRAETTNGQAHK